jgi:hypothetical protein
MPNAQDHLTQAEANRTYALNFDPQDATSIQWAVTVAFYAALHYVEALFATEVPALHFTQHTKRTSALGRLGNTRPVFQRLQQPYSDLKDYSEQARYDCQVFTATQLQNVILPLLQQIETDVRGALPPGTI